MGSASKQSDTPSDKVSGKQSGKQPGKQPNRSAGGRTSQADRRARIAELRAAEQRRDRRNRFIAITVAVVLVAGMIGFGGWIALDAKHKQDLKTAAAKAAAKAKQDAANVPIDGVKTFDLKTLTRNHVTTPVTYPQIPPVGGDHNPVWLDCMGTVYDKPVHNENAVHSLEHGAVWVTYNGKATADDIKTLSAKVKATTYSLMSPYPDETGTITLTAWGTQLIVDKADDPRVNQFFTKYVQGPQTQEPGASCSTGAMQ